MSAHKIELNEIAGFLRQAIAEETKVDIQQIGEEQSMGVYGLDSINSVYVLHRVEKFLDLELNPLIFWDYPTVKSLSQHLHQLVNGKG